MPDLERAKHEMERSLTGLREMQATIDRLALTPYETVWDMKDQYAARGAICFIAAFLTMEAYVAKLEGEATTTSGAGGEAGTDADE